MGYCILLLAVTIIAYSLFARRFDERAKAKDERVLERRNRLWIIGTLVIWLVLASVALWTGGIVWILLAVVATIVCTAYIIRGSYNGTDMDHIGALTYLILPFAFFVFCVIVKIGGWGGVIGGIIAAAVVAALPRVVFLQGLYDKAKRR